MGRLEAFQVPGCRCWFFTGDHDAPHFHAGAPDEWEIKVFFLQEPVVYEELWAAKRIPGGVLKRLLKLTAANRDQLLEQWERSVADD